MATSIKGKVKEGRGLAGCVAINELCCASDLDVQQKLPLSALLQYGRAEGYCVAPTFMCLLNHRLSKLEENYKASRAVT